jgi:hypothetical protein
MRRISCAHAAIRAATGQFVQGPQRFVHHLL